MKEGFPRNTPPAEPAPTGLKFRILFYHQWQFLAPDGSDGSVDPVPLSLFEQYIDHLKDRGDLQFTTLEIKMCCLAPPRRSSN